MRGIWVRGPLDQLQSLLATTFNWPGSNNKAALLDLAGKGRFRASILPRKVNITGRMHLFSQESEHSGRGRYCRQDVRKI
eukprot:1158195-Pelagomonas_calceolata.AAC.6